MTIREAAYASLVNDDAKTFEKLLLKHRVVLLGEGNDVFLMSHAAGQGRLAHVQILAKFGTDVNASQDEDPEGALVSAAREGHQEVVRWFLDHGATINHVVDGKSRCFALTGGVRNGHLDVVKLLVERGADVTRSAPDYSRSGTLSRITEPRSRPTFGRSGRRRQTSWASRAERDPMNLATADVSSVQWSARSYPKLRYAFISPEIAEKDTMDSELVLKYQDEIISALHASSAELHKRYVVSLPAFGSDYLELIRYSSLFVNRRDAVEFATDCARRALPFWQRVRSADLRPLLAVDSAEQYVRNRVSLDELEGAWSGANDAARELDTPEITFRTQPAIVSAILAADSAVHAAMSAQNSLMLDTGSEPDMLNGVAYCAAHAAFYALKAHKDIEQSESDVQIAQLTAIVAAGSLSSIDAKCVTVRELHEGC